MSIPRVFHQIWINEHQPALPEVFASYRDSWLRHHPDWDYCLWNLGNLPFKSRNAEKLASCGSYAQMADVLRYEILYELGGVYLDTDFECLRSIEPILAGVKNFACSEDGQALSIGIIGAEHGSALMERCANGIPAKLGVDPPTLETGPGFFTRVVLGGGFNNDLTVFPRGWFYPYNWNELHRVSEIFPEAYGIHRWAHSWAEKDYGVWRRVKRRLSRIAGALR